MLPVAGVINLISKKRTKRNEWKTPSPNNCNAVIPKGKIHGVVISKGELRKYAKRTRDREPKKRNETTWTNCCQLSPAIKRERTGKGREQAVSNDCGVYVQ